MSFRELRAKFNVDATKAEKPKREKRERRKKVKLTPEEAADRRHEHDMRQRATILSILPLGNGQYKVWGGEEPHVVTVTIDGAMSCDCRGWAGARHQTCSHIYKYRLVYGDLKK